METRRKVLSVTVLLTLFLTACCALAPKSVLAEQPPISFVRTVQVTPDGQFLTGCFARINYVSATDRFVASFGTKASTEYPDQGAGFVYKEYTVDMLETGKTGILEWLPNSSESGDMGSCMVNNTYYCAFMSQLNESYGWRLVKYDAVSWARLNETSVAIQSPNESNADPMVAYVNGQLDISDQYNPIGISPEGNSSLHRFFTADLQLIGMRELNDTANVVGGSMMFVDGVYYFVTANNFFGDVILMKYDVNWNYLGMKPLILQAHWSTGMTYDGKYFYLAYLDTSQRTPVTQFPIYPNVHLAVFDRDWNLKYDAAVTNFTLASDHKAGRPWVMLHGNRLYVSYDVDSVNKTTEEEQKKWQAFVSIFEIAPPDLSAPEVGTPVLSPSRNSVQPFQSVRVSVNVTDLESGVKNVTLTYSLDNGTTWQSPELMGLNTTSGFREGIIPGQPINTEVRFKIVAFDNAENTVTKDGTTLDYTYIVVPEFPVILALFMFMIVTLLSGIVSKRGRTILRLGLG